MGRQALTKESIKKQTVSKMRKLGVYKPEFDDVIDVYAGLCSQYRRLEIDFEKKGAKYAAKTNSGDAKKAPEVSAMENLRKDILLYSDRLMINPKANLKGDDDLKKGKAKNRLVAALESLEK